MCAVHGVMVLLYLHCTPVGRCGRRQSWRIEQRKGRAKGDAGAAVEDTSISRCGNVLHACMLLLLILLLRCCVAAPGHLGVSTGYGCIAPAMKGPTFAT